jgi:four helix bundle protein
MKDFTEIHAWQEAHQLTLAIYRMTACWPREEMFRLTNQVIRSAGSIGANIAEGFGRFNDKEFHQFCNIARGSLYETQNHLLVARDLGYCTQEEWKAVHQQSMIVLRLLQGLMRSLRPS